MCSGRTTRLFLSGDYEFLCRMYGLSGASGMQISASLHSMYKHTSIYTYFRSPQLLMVSDTQKQLANTTERTGQVRERSLESLSANYLKFVSAGGNLKLANNFNNVIGKYFYDIPLDNVRHYVENY